MKSMFQRSSTFGTTIGGVYPAGRGNPETLVIFLHEGRDYGVWWTGKWGKVAAPSLYGKGHECLHHPCKRVDKRTRFTAWRVQK